jgi:phenylalanyl-tRNA synthetase beta chain
VDVIEEIIRIYGLDNIPVPDQAQLPLMTSDLPGVYDYRNKVSYILNGAGFHEAMSLSLVHSAIYEDYGGQDDLVWVNNSSNRQLDAMRKEMYSSLLLNCERNYNRQDRDVRLFEFGKTFSLNGEGKHQEAEHLCLGLMGKRHTPSRFQKEEGSMGFFDIKAEAERVFHILGVSGFQTSEVYDHDFLSYGIRWHRGPVVLAELGKVKPQFTSVKLDQEVFAADIYWATCLAAVRDKETLFTPLGKYPSVERDLALVIDESVSFEDIKRVIYKVEKKWVRDIVLFDHYTHADQLGEGKKSYAIRILLQSDEKTLTDKNVDKVIQKMITTLEKNVGARLR